MTTPSSSYVPRGFDFATQIVTNAAHPLGERIFIDREGVVFARVAMTQGTSYGIVCRALLDAFVAADKATWDRDDNMDFYTAVTGRAAQP